MSHRHRISLLLLAVAFSGYGFPIASPARARAQADRRSASLLLPRNVSAAAYDRAQRSRLVARFAKSLVYSMAGSLWRQKLDSTVAEQITAGSGYDYQPDCSSDGRWVVYASYLKDAVELWVPQSRDRKPLGNSPPAAPSTSSRASRLMASGSHLSPRHSTDAFIFSSATSAMAN